MRPHSALGYRPPVPEVVLIKTLQVAPLWGASQDSNKSRVLWEFWLNSLIPGNFGGREC